VGEDRTRTERDQSRDSNLVDELRDRVAYLERQVEEEREARRRADTILAQLSQANTELSRTIRTIETPASEATAAFSQEPSVATEQPGRVEPQPAVEGTQEGTEPSEPREAP
jgi:chromosome segregation ATPase